jgi:hypothetical protein
MSMCVPTRVTTIQAAEREVEAARRVLEAADGVDWVSDAADRYRAMLAEVIGVTVHLSRGLEGAFRAVDAAHVAVDEAAHRAASALADPRVGIGDTQDTWVPWRAHL